MIVEAGDEGEESRLAGAVEPEQHRPIATIELEGDAAQGLPRTECVAESGDRQRRRLRARRRSLRRLRFEVQHWLVRN